jgi:hypothetical protein
MIQAVHLNPDKDEVNHKPKKEDAIQNKKAA